jgi:23S rRNA (adenine2503-C2)-methyltransferase
MKIKKITKTPFKGFVYNFSKDENVAELFDLFDPQIWQATLSVICERTEYLAVANEFQRSLATNFADKMVKAGYNTRVFDPAGQDTIGGGCGMLWFVQSWAKDNPDKVRPSCGTGKPQIHTPVILNIK